MRSSGPVYSLPMFLNIHNDGGLVPAGYGTDLQLVIGYRFHLSMVGAAVTIGQSCTDPGGEPFRIELGLLDGGHDLRVALEEDQQFVQVITQEERRFGTGQVDVDGLRRAVGGNDLADDGIEPVTGRLEQSRQGGRYNANAGVGRVSLRRPTTGPTTCRALRRSLRRSP